MTESVETTALNARSSRLVAVRKLLRRKYRDQRELFLAEGPNAVGAALARPDTVVEVFVSDPSRHLDLLGAHAQISVQLVEEPSLRSLAETVNPQGIVAVCRFLDGELPVSPRLVVVLDQVSDPGNAGTILRTADAAGADAVVFPQDAVDPYNGKCVRASAGSLFQLSIVRGGDTGSHLDRLRENGLTVLATEPRASVDLDQVIEDGTLRRPTAWLFGSEAHGLSAGLAAQADLRVRVPIYGRAESLNLSTAAAVCLYASAREFRTGETDGTVVSDQQHL